MNEYIVLVTRPCIIVKESSASADAYCNVRIRFACISIFTGVRYEADFEAGRDILAIAITAMDNQAVTA